MAIAIRMQCKTLWFYTPLLYLIVSAHILMDREIDWDDIFEWLLKCRAAKMTLTYLEV